MRSRCQRRSVAGWTKKCPESLVWKQPCQRSGHRPVGGLARQTVDLASEDRHLVAEHDDLDCEVRVGATGHADELEDAAERPVQEREGHPWMLAASATDRQSPGQLHAWMTLSAPTGVLGAVSFIRCDSG